MSRSMVAIPISSSRISIFNDERTGTSLPFIDRAIDQNVAAIALLPLSLDRAEIALTAYNEAGQSRRAGKVEIDSGVIKVDCGILDDIFG